MNKTLFVLLTLAACAPVGPTAEAEKPPPRFSYVQATGLWNGYVLTDHVTGEEYLYISQTACVSLGTKKQQ